MPVPLVRAVVEVLGDWRPSVAAIAVVESATRPTLVRDLADGLSRYLRVPVAGTFAIVDPSVPPGRGAVNSAQRVAAVSRRFAWRPEADVRSRGPRCCWWTTGPSPAGPSPWLPAPFGRRGRRRCTPSCWRRRADRPGTGLSFRPGHVASGKTGWWPVGGGSYADRVTQASSNAAPEYPDHIDGAVLKIAGVVVLGAIMTILDITVVNVALPTFQTVFTSIDDPLALLHGRVDGHRLHPGSRDRDPADRLGRRPLRHQAPLHRRDRACSRSAPRSAPRRPRSRC